MPSITVPSSFFRKEKQNLYADWRTAFWRELLSNAVDAGASNIQIRARFNGERFLVDVADNGSGMTREVIEDVYMRLGASSKEGDPDSVGGFGRARILTCFGQNSYQIRTRDILVKGNGAQYDILPAERDIKGTVISVDVDEHRPASLLRSLYSVLEQSSLRCRITLDLPGATPDGRELPQPDDGKAPRDEATGHRRFHGWSRKGREFGSLADEQGNWGTLHVSRGAKALRKKAIVRVNGMAMYEETIAADAQVVIDLDPARAREVMTVSRDSVRWEFREAMSKLFNKIAADQTSTFREKAKEPVREIHFGRGGRAGFIINRRQTEPDEIDDRQPHPVDDLSAIREMNRERHSGHADSLSAMPEPTKTGHDGAGSDATPAARLPVAVFIDNATAAQRSAAKRFNPETWAEPGNAGRTAELLHAAWTAACRHAIGRLVDFHPDLDGESWSTGFVFDEKMEACHVRMGEIKHALLINPVDAEGRQRFRLSDPHSMKKLIAVAIHEVTHCVHDWHDESYASLFTDLVGAIRDKDIELEIRTELDQARGFIEARDARLTSRNEPAPEPV